MIHINAQIIKRKPHSFLRKISKQVVHDSISSEIKLYPYPLVENTTNQSFNPTDELLVIHLNLPKPIKKTLAKQWVNIALDLFIGPHIKQKQPYIAIERKSKIGHQISLVINNTISYHKQPYHMIHYNDIIDTSPLLTDLTIKHLNLQKVKAPLFYPEQSNIYPTGYFTNNKDKWNHQLYNAYMQGQFNNRDTLITYAKEQLGLQVTSKGKNYISFTQRLNPKRGERMQGGIYKDRWCEKSIKKEINSFGHLSFTLSKDTLEKLTQKVNHRIGFLNKYISPHL